jgi:hypothetical protein
MDELLRAYDECQERGVLSTAQGDTSVLRRCMVQQLQQADMFEQSAATMLAAAELLQAEAAAIAAAMRSAAAPLAQTPSAHGSDGSSGSQSSGSMGSTSAVGSSKVSYMCHTAMKMGPRLLPLQEVDTKGWSCLVEATAALTVAAVRFITVVTSRARTGDLLCPRLSDVTGCTLFYLMHTLRDSNNRQLLQSSAVSSAVSLAVLLVHTHSLLPLKVQQHANRSLDISNGGSSSSSASGGKDAGMFEILAHMLPTEPEQRHALRAWKAAQKLEAPLQQPLLQTLGLSTRAVGWVAGNILVGRNEVEFTACAVDALSQHSWEFMRFNFNDGAQREPLPPEELETILQQEGVLPALQERLPPRMLLVQLLLTAQQQQHQQARTAGAMAAWVVNCRSVVLTALNAVGCARNDWAGQCSLFEEASPQLAAEARQQGWQQFRLILGGWMGAAMPVVLTLLAALLHEAEGAVAAAAAAAAAAATAPGVPGSSKSSSSSSLVVAALQDCVLLLTLLGRQNFEVELTEIATVSSAGDPQYLKAWAEHSAAISTALEGVWRVQGRLGPCGGDGADAKGWDLRGTSQLSVILGEGGALVLAAQQAGVGSIEQRQLFSMLCCLVKLCKRLSNRGIEDADKCIWWVLQSAAVMLDQPGSYQQLQQQPAGGDAAAAGAQDTTVATAAATAARTSQQQSGAEGLLPWLLLLGRCFLHHGEQLLQLQQHMPDIGERLHALAGDALPPIETALPGVHDWHPAAFLLKGSTWLLNSCSLCLARGVGMGSLAAAGYPIHSAVQHTHAAIAALYAFETAVDAAASAAAYTAFTQQLQALGGVLSTLPVPYACNNPGCTNMLGPTELASVSGRSCICAGCVVARYCGRVCQRACWKQHKPVCQALAAAAAAPAGAGM